ncbi:MAG TPA: DUF4340 domain-containing protein [Spirochaetota bacterium]|nr:DUF4340 domain-containing protein [Spirochaetota bacterium]HPN82264.1 DUF4340 domain-containing protein [Spirochaetota bacterium]
MARRKFPTMTVMAILAAGLAAWAVFVEIPKAKNEANPDKVPLLQGLVAQEVTKIESLGNDKWTLVKETNNQWRFVSPQPWRVDQTAVQTMLDEATTFEAVQTLKKKNPQLDQYGLTAPRSVLILTGKERRWHLSFGDENRTAMEQPQRGQQPPSSLTYLVLDGTGPVHLVETFKANLLARPAGHLRYKKIFEPDIPTMNTIEMRYQGTTTRLERINEVWHVVVNGEKKPADMQKVLAVVGDLYEISVDEFVSDRAEAASYGIRTDGDYLRLVDSKGTHTLFFGRTERGKVYCATEAVGEIWGVLPATYEKLNKKPFEFLPAAATNTNAPPQR